MTAGSSRVLGHWGVWLVAGTLACATGENDGAPAPADESGAGSSSGGSANGSGGDSAGPNAGGTSSGASSGGTSSGGTSSGASSGGTFASGGTFGTAGTFASGGTFSTAGQAAGGKGGSTSGGGGATNGGGGSANGGASAGSAAGGMATGGKSGGTCSSAKLTPTGATASGMERADLGPQFAIDGDTTTTRWASEQMNDAAWMLVDLGEVATVDRVVIVWEAAYATSYKVQIATSAAGPFQDLFADANGNGGTDDVSTFTPATGRYVRMQGVTRKTMYGYSLWEMTVYGDKDETCD